MTSNVIKLAQAVETVLRDKAVIKVKFTTAHTTEALQCLELCETQEGGSFNKKRRVFFSTDHKNATRKRH